VTKDKVKAVDGLAGLYEIEHNAPLEQPLSTAPKDAGSGGGGTPPAAPEEAP
jgi:hypothetical protein